MVDGPAGIIMPAWLKRVCKKMGRNMESGLVGISLTKKNIIVHMRMARDLGIIQSGIQEEEKLKILFTTMEIV